MPPPEPDPIPEPGERQPDATRRRLSHAPADRYRTGSPTPTDSSRPSAARAVTAAILTALVGAALLTVILGVFTSTGGTFAVTLLASIVIGLCMSTASVSAVHATAPPLDRGRAVQIAAALGVGMLVATGIGVWLVARAEGGVLDPVGYLWTTFGAGLPVLAVVALVGAAWGAANGPIRWRS